MTSVIDRIDPKNPSREDLRELTELLKRLREVDVRTVDAGELVEATEVRVRGDLPVFERYVDYLRQIRNPYCYKVNGTVVKVRFAGERSASDCVRDALFGGGGSNPGLPRYGEGGSYD